MEFESKIVKPSRDQVMQTLRTVLPGVNLWEKAHYFRIPVQWGEKKNKGWVGQTIERLAGLSLSSDPAPDGHDFELKTTSLILREGLWVPKETLKITQLNPQHILEEEFSTSLLWKKLERLVLVGCCQYSPSRVEAIKISSITISAPSLIQELRAFWEDVRHLVCSGEIKSHINLGNSDSLLQLRPLGDGKQRSQCPITGEFFPARAFYATKKLINLLMRSEDLGG